MSNEKEISFEEGLDEYESVLQDFTKHLKLCKSTTEFVPDMQKQFSKKLHKDSEKQLKELSPKEFKQVKEAMELVLGQMKNIKEFPATIGGTFTMKNKKVAETLEKTFDSIQISKLIENNIFETSLIYLITTFEAFLKDTFKIELKNDLRLLSSNKEMTHGEILKSKSLDELKDKILEKESEGLMDKDIEKLGKKLAEDFKIHLTGKDNWKDFTERFYRRHVIVHNNSVPDEKYRFFTKSNTQELKTDQKYILKSVELFGEYSKEITQTFRKHFPIK